MKPKISVIVPVYNTEIYLNKCLDSILNQTFDDIELILINDGSTDNSGEICDEYASLDKRVQVIHKHNNGQAAARNMGIKLAKGEYIGFVDSDDWVDKQMFIKLYEHAFRSKSDIIACNFNVMNKEGEFKPYLANAVSKEYDKDEAMKEIFTNQILTFSPCNKIYKKRLFEKVEFVEGIILEDMDISYKLINESTRISYIKDCLYYYCYNEKSTLRSTFSLKRVDEFLVAKEMYNFYLDKYPEISDLVYYNLYATGSHLNMLINIYYKEKLKDYRYLIDFDKCILKRLLKNKQVSLMRRVKIFLGLYSPYLSMQVRKITYKIKGSY